MSFVIEKGWLVNVSVLLHPIWNYWSNVANRFSTRTLSPMCVYEREFSMHAWWLQTNCFLLVHHSRYIQQAVCKEMKIRITSKWDIPSFKRLFSVLETGHIYKDIRRIHLALSKNLSFPLNPVDPRATFDPFFVTFLLSFFILETMSPKKQTSSSNIQDQRLCVLRWQTYMTWMRNNEGPVLENCRWRTDGSTSSIRLCFF